MHWNLRPGIHWIVVALVLWPLSASGAEQWMLMSRDGSCVTLAKASERRPEFRGITTPGQLVARLRSQGVDVRAQKISQGGTTVVQIDAPDRGLGLIFVPDTMCP